MRDATSTASEERAADRTQAGPVFATQVVINRAAVVAVVEPVAVAAGYDLEDLAVVRMGRRFVVRVTIDRDGGVPLDDVADLARAVSAALDDVESTKGDLIPGEYQLEVSSPGVDRPLKLPRHWKRNVGRLVKVKVAGHTVIGRVVAADDAGVRLDVDGDVRDLAYGEIGAGRVEIEFSRIDDVAEEDMVEFDPGDDDGGDDGGGDDGDDGDDDRDPDDEDEEDER